MTLLEMGHIFENEYARRRLKAAMRVVSGEVRAETIATDANQKQVEKWQKRKLLVERWREAHAHWELAVIDRVADLTEIQAVAENLCKDDAALTTAEIQAVDTAVLQAVRDAVDAMRSAV